MIIRQSSLDLMQKYLIPTGENTYKLKEIPDSDSEKEKLLELDELQFISYGYHMIDDYEKL